jgi:2-aminophenol/2-amino-5-chlorophenol 1,6-dioxygenase alpha subunit
MSGALVGALIVPGKPHPLLCPEANPGYRALRQGFEAARGFLAEVGAERLVLYSTSWLSVIGHQVQARPEPEWVHVDPQWHALGAIPYKLRMDPELARATQRAASARGLHARTVDYHGFPVDTGSVVALQLLDPERRLPATVVSCNLYADRTETLVLGKAARDAVEAIGRRTVAVAVTGLSHRHFTTPIDPAQDRIATARDDEWNRKLLELLGEGRLEDVSQLAREVTRQVQVDQKLKAIWWLAAVMGQHNGFEGKVLSYAPIWGTGAAVVTLRPSPGRAIDKEYDEADAEVFAGERGVLDRAEGPAPAPAAVTVPAPSVGPPAGPLRNEPVTTDRAPKPVGPYPHARRVGPLVYVSGIGPRQPGSGSIAGGPIRDEWGAALAYDVRAQTRQTIENLKAILEAAGTSLERVVDATLFLVDMDRDFAAVNEVYGQYFWKIQPTRTTVAVTALPTPIAVELKVVALAGDA